MDSKLIIFDIDGTAVEARPDAYPTSRLIEVVSKLQVQLPQIHLSCATGRTYPWAEPVTSALGLTDPCIVSAGTQIIDPTSGEEVWSKRLTQEAVKSSLAVFADMQLDPRILTETDTPETAKLASQINPETFLLLDVQDILPDQVDEVISRIKAVSDVEIAKVNSPNPGFINLHITDIEATKEHAVGELKNILKISTSHTYGIGDGYNDIHLFNAVGKKLAMGNAVPELKEVADEVIGSLAEDGLAIYLESFLN